MNREYGPLFLVWNSKAGSSWSFDQDMFYENQSEHQDLLPSCLRSP